MDFGVNILILKDIREALSSLQDETKSGKPISEIEILKINEFSCNKYSQNK